MLDKEKIIQEVKCGRQIWNDELYGFIEIKKQLDKLDDEVEWEKYPKIRSYMELAKSLQSAWSSANFWNCKKRFATNIHKQMMEVLKEIEKILDIPDLFTGEYRESL